MLYLTSVTDKLHKKAMKKLLSEFNELIHIYSNSPFSLQCAAMKHSLDFSDTQCPDTRQPEKDGPRLYKVRKPLIIGTTQ